MPNFSGIWTVTQQMQAKGASTWPATPGAPTIGTASVASATSVSVPFTAPSCTGYPAGITSYLVISTPGCISNTGASSPIVVSGLTTGTSYTFKAQAQNASGYGALSAASNSVTPAIIGQQAYTTPGTYSWVAPAGVTSVSAVAVGGGGGGQRLSNLAGGGGGGLGWKNNITVTPGNSYTVVVGVGGTGGGSNGGQSYFSSSGTVAGLGGVTPAGSGGTGGSYVGDGGGSGGSNGNSHYGGAGAGGYAGNGSAGGCGVGGSGGAGSGGGQVAICGYYQGQGGGGVGILGQGANGAYPGGGGSGGAAGQTPSAVGCTPAGGAYGGGGSWTGTGGGGGSYYNGNGAGGAVRIIWPGTFRQFPSTCTGNL